MKFQKIKKLWKIISADVANIKANKNKKQKISGGCIFYYK